VGVAATAIVIAAEARRAARKPALPKAVNRSRRLGCIDRRLANMILRAIAIACVAVAIFGCIRNNGGSKKLQIAVIPKGTSHQFWKSIHAGALQAAEELGDVEILWKGPQTEDNTAGQKEVVKGFIAKRVDGICLAPNDSQGLIDVVQEANEEEIPVVVYDSGLGKGADFVSYVATDNYKGGQMAADRMAEVVGPNGNVILLRYREGSESTEQRERGFLERLKEKHSGITVLSSDQYAQESARKAYSAIKPLLDRYKGELNGVFAVCEPNCNGTLEALEETELAGKVKFIAFDPSDALIAGMSAKPAKVHGIVLQDPVHMGYMAVKTLVAHLRGETVPAVVDTGEAVATPENMDTDKFRKLLRPKLAE
jgi:ribose transport system substrate-binding protein